MTRALGLLLLAVAAFLGCRWYLDLEERRVRETEGLLSLLVHLRVSLGTYAPPLERIYAAFRNEALARSGFLSVLQREGMRSALTVAPPLGLCEEELLPLLRFSTYLGQHFLEDEVASTDEMITYLSQIAEKKRRDVPRRKRLGRALFATGGAMVAILFI